MLCFYTGPGISCSWQISSCPSHSLAQVVFSSENFNYNWATSGKSSQNSCQTGDFVTCYWIFFFEIQNKISVFIQYLNRERKDAGRLMTNILLCLGEAVRQAGLEAISSLWWWYDTLLIFDTQIHCRVLYSRRQLTEQ